MNQAIITVDLGFGDAGKGSVVDFLTRETGAHTVIRFNGGAQAGHRVVTPAGQEHVFSQFGAGTLAGADTFLSKYMLVEPLAMLSEAAHLVTLGLSDPLNQVYIDRRARITTPFHRAINRLRELARGDGRHGSCGMGIGETMVDWLAHGDQVLIADDLRDVDRLLAKIRFMRALNLAKLNQFRDQLPDIEQVRIELEMLEDPVWIDYLMEDYALFATDAHIVSSRHTQTILSRPGSVIFEAAQGVLLDEWYGFHPHTTWSTTTLANAYEILAEAGYSGDLSRIGITRAYATRHGAGPFVSEDDAWSETLPDACNHFGPWQTGFRVGPLDLVALNYAAKVVGSLDGMAVTCLDRLAEMPDATIPVCAAYRMQQTGRQLSDIPVKLDSQLENLDIQAELTDLLHRCDPILTDLPDVSTLIHAIERATSTPVIITSNGPKATDKRWRNQFPPTKSMGSAFSSRPMWRPQFKKSALT